MPTAVLVLLVILAVAGGLYLGFRAGQQRTAVDERPAAKSLGARAREAATQGAFSLWKWNRARKKKARDRDESER